MKYTESALETALVLDAGATTFNATLLRLRLRRWLSIAALVNAASVEN